MSESNESVTPQDPGIQAVLDGVSSIARSTEDMRQKMQSALDQEKKDSERRDADLREAMEKSTADLIARQNRQSQIFSVMGRELNIRPGDNVLRELIPAEIKQYASGFEAAAAAMHKESALRDAEVLMGAQTFFVASTKSQLGKFASTAGRNAELAEKVYGALQEWKHGSNWQAVTKAALQEDQPTEGGNLVPTIVESDVIRQIKDAAKLFPRARQVQMTKKVHQMPSESGAVTINWVAEEGTLTGGEPSFGQKTLTALKLAGRATMSIELVEDSNVGLLAYLLEVFSEKMGGELDKQMVCGDGAGPAITGIDNTVGINVIASSATGRNLTWPLLVSTYVGSGEGSAIENGVWIVSPKGYAALYGLSDSTGQPIVKFADVENAPAGVLMGRPIVLSARFGGAPSGVTATLDDATGANTKIIYGVPTSILAGTRQGMRWDVTDQVNWALYQIDCRLVGRFAMVVGVPANFSRLNKVNT